MLSSAYLHNESLLFCFAGPTASGKTSVCKALADKDPTLQLSVSTTTRKPRAQEVDGRDYYFVNKSEFKRRVDADYFLEYAIFGDHYYGTGEDQLEEDALSDILLDIEIQGVKQVRQQFPERCVVVFVVPPSFAVLESRLRERRSEDEESIQRRLEIARHEFEELRKPENSDYLIVNDNLDASVEEALHIIRSERRKLSRIAQKDLDAFFSNDKA